MTDQDTFGPSPFDKVAKNLGSVISGLGFAAIGLPSDLFYENVIRRERLVAEIAAAANVSIHEVLGFYDSSGYSLEFIKAAIQAGARLDKEDIKRTMEERTVYQFDKVPRHWRGFEEIGKSLSTFVITTPTNDRIKVEAVDCCLDSGCLIFEDGEGTTVLAIAAGHWVSVRQVKDDQNTRDSD